jgi:hypothetical protein
MSGADGQQLIAARFRGGADSGRGLGHPCCSAIALGRSAYILSPAIQHDPLHRSSDAGRVLLAQRFDLRISIREIKPE